MSPRKKIIVNVLIVMGLALLALGTHRFANWYSLQQYWEVVPGYLHQTVADGDVEKVEELLRLGADPNRRNKYMGTPLHELARTWSRPEHEEVFRLLMEQGADINAVNAHGRTPLGVAANAGNEASYGQLKAAGATVRLVDAVRMNDGDRVTAILARNASAVDDSFEYGRTALMVAAKCGYVDLVRTLLDAGADPNAQSDYLYTALHFSCYDNSAEIAELLLAHGAYPDLVANAGFTPLIYMAYGAQPRSIELLLNAGADPLAVDSRNGLPIHRINNHYSLNDHYVDGDPETSLRILLDAGSPVDAIDGDGRTPLFPAVRWGSTATVQRMLELGADPNHRDNENRTPLFFATTENTSVLVAAGAEPNVVSTDGKTPLYGALDPWGHVPRDGPDIALIEILLAAGADPALSGPGENSAMEEAWARFHNRHLKDYKPQYEKAIELMEAALSESVEGEAQP